jgi:molybdenum cofactor guanylyltransferase
MTAIDHNSRPAITGVILAGGRNSRMGGQHKALLHWRQRPFIAHIVERIQPQVEQLVINSNRPQLFTDCDLPIIADPFAEQRGPLAGILAGLNYSTTPLTLFVPCDNPQISTELVARLWNVLHHSNAEITYASTATDDHYLYVLMRSDLRDSVEEFLQRGKSAVRQWYAQQSCSKANFDTEAASFVNINSPEDLIRLT